MRPSSPHQINPSADEEEEDVPPEMTYKRAAGHITSRPAATL
jgi:hypothetical protein